MITQLVCAILRIHCEAWVHTAGRECVRARVCVHVCRRRGRGHSREIEGVDLGVPEWEPRRGLGPLEWETRHRHGLWELEGTRGPAPP